MNMFMAVDASVYLSYVAGYCHQTHRGVVDLCRRLVPCRRP